MKLKTMLFVVAIVTLTIAAQAVTIDLVPVGNAGNVNDPETGYGGVDYTYMIGKYEITAGQYCEFLNAVADTDTYGLYNENMNYDVNPSEWGCNIQRSGEQGSYTYSVAPDWAKRPVNYVSWGDAARFANWLSNNQPTGAQDPLTTEDGAYLLNGATTFEQLMAVTPQPTAIWVIPSKDELYKAAFHKNDGVTGNYWDYPTRSDTEPINTLPDPGNHANFYDYSGTGNGGYSIGSPYYRTEVGDFENSASPYGTFDQGGNVFEWNEETTDSWNRGISGGEFNRSSDFLAAYAQGCGYSPIGEGYFIGIRIAYVPEPGSIVLLICGAIADLMWWRFRK